MPFYSTISKKGQVTIPAAVRERLGVRAGGRVAFEVTQDGISLQPARDFFALYGSVPHDAGPIDFSELRERTKNVIAERARDRGAVNDDT